jgi:hypothetical protein
MGVPPDRQSEFFSLAQDHYLTMMQAGDTSPKVMLTALQAAMTGQPTQTKVFTNR